MRYKLSEKWSRDTVSVPRRALKYLTEAAEAELCVLLAACDSAQFDETELFSALSERFSETEISAAIAFWRGAGVLVRATGKDAPKKDAPALRAAEPAPEVKVISSRPSYTAIELAEAVEQSADFKSLIDYAEGRLKKNFNGADLNLLYSFVDYLALPVEVVMLAIEACAAENKRSLRYIEKLLLALSDDGIDSYEAAEAYFARRAEYLSFEGQVRAMCGFGTRSLSAGEKKILATWVQEYKLTIDEVRQAYDKTITAIAKPSLSYMNKVIHTMRETAREPDRPDAVGGTAKSYDTEGRFAAAVARTKKKQTKEQS